MASTQVTYGRKRSLLRTFGSRRRHKDFAVSISPLTDGKDHCSHGRYMLIKTYTVTTPTKPVRETEPEIAPEVPHRHSRHVGKSGGVPINARREARDVITRAQSLRARNAETPSKRPPERSQDYAEIVRNRTLSPFQMHPVVIPTSESLEESPVRSVLKRSSLGAPQLSHGIQHNRRYTTNSVQLEKTAELLKLLETSTQVPEDSPTPKEKLDSRVQVRQNHTMQEEIAGERSSSLRALGDCVHPASAEEINDKVREMLAAMDALKPDIPQRGQGSRKLSRVTNSRVFVKMSDALGRICSKSVSPEGRAGDKGSGLHFEETGISSTRSLGQMNASQHSIRSIEIRLNEGTNLNRSKVQQIFGNQVFRKPVASKGYSLLYGKVDDQFHSEEAAMSKERSEGTIQPFLSRTNPFETEEDFEGNLRSGCLNASPAGSSTPRHPTKRASNSTLGDDSINDWSGSSFGQIDYARIVYKIGKQDTGSPQIRQVNLQPPTDTNGLSPRPWQRPKRSRIVQEDDLGIAKKHPSPSKRDLEELELAFRRYGLPRGAPIDDDADELAASNAFPGEVLAIKDPNRKLQSQGSQTQIKRASLQPTTRTFPSRIPRPLSHAGNRESTEIRLAVECRPKNAIPGESDELL